MAANVAVAQDPAGNLKLAKDKSTERIDGVIAAITAIGRAMVAQEEPQPEYSMFSVRWTRDATTHEIQKPNAAVTWTSAWRGGWGAPLELLTRRRSGLQLVPAAG
jgi:hypothetical protein